MYCFNNSHCYVWAVFLFTLIILSHTFSVHAAASPNTLKGKVTDDKGIAIPGAIVLVTDLKVGAAADTNGNYRITNLPKGKFVVQAKMLGYAAITIIINIDGETVQNFKLNESIIENSEVVITGASVATEERKNITPIQSISLKEIHEDASTNIIDAISKIPGVSQLSTGPAASKPVIRGLGYNRVITMNDGVRQEGQQWGDEHGIEIDDYDVSKVEILKGPASLAYGSDALAGVINIISDKMLPENKIQGSITTNYQTNNGLAAIHAQLAGNTAGWTWGAYITQKIAHDYQNANDGFVYNTRFSNTDFGANVGVNKHWGYSRLSFSSFNQILGIAEGNRDSATGKITKPVNINGIDSEIIATNADGHSYSRDVPYQRINHQKITWNNDFYLENGGRLDFTLAFQQNNRREFSDVLQPEIVGLNLLLQTLTYDVKYFLPTIKGWQFTTGVNGMQQTNANQGDEFLVPNYSLFDGGIYAIGKKDWGAWSVSGGLRYNLRLVGSDAMHISDTATGWWQFTKFDRTFSNFSGSLGARYSINAHTTLKFNISNGFRAPNIAELSANGVHDGTFRYEYGNKIMDAENSVQGDVGFLWSSAHVLINATLFYNHIYNYIYISKLQNAQGGDSIPQLHNPNGYSAYIYAQSNANLYGGELFVDFHPHPFDWLHFENTFSYVRGMRAGATEAGTENLPNMPPPRWLAMLRGQGKKVNRFIKNVYAKVGVDITMAQNNIFSAYGTETTTPAYTLLDAGMGADIVNKKNRTLFTLTLTAQNITDVAYQSHLSRLKYAPTDNVTGRMGLYNMGRNMSIMLNIPLSLK
jgi:iron complex outermembrane receptor protein